MSCKTSYPLDEVDNIPDHDLPLAVQFKNTKVFDDDPTGLRAAEKQLTAIFLVHGGPVVQAIPLAQSSFGTGNIDATFFHPGSLRRFIDNNAWSALSSPKGMRMSLKLTTDISARPEELALWIGGCPDWKEDAEELKDLIKECLNFDFVLDFLDDPLRREILVVSPVAVNNINFKMSLYNMVREALKHFEKNPIKWKRRKRLLLVKSASDLFVRKWKERLGSPQPLSTVETDLIKWTEELLEKRAKDLGLVATMRDVSPAPVRARPSPKKRPQQRRGRSSMSDGTSEPTPSPKKKQQKSGAAPTMHNGGESSSSIDVQLPTTTMSPPCASTSTSRNREGWRGIGVKREFDEERSNDTHDPYDQPGPSNAVMSCEMDSCPDDIAILDDEDSQSDSIEWLDDAGNIIGRQAPSFSGSSSVERSNESPFNGEARKVGRKKGKKKVVVRCYMDPEDAAERKLGYQQDTTVKNLLQKLERARRERGEESVVITMTFTKNDDASLKRRVNRMYKSLHKRGDLVEDEDARKLKNGKAIKKKWGLKYEGKTIPGNHTKYIIEGFPFSTPRRADGSLSYDLVTVMDDSQGPLECYATRQPTVVAHDGNGIGVEEQCRKNPDPAYTFISTNEKEESPQAEHLREKAKRCTIKCQCEGVCRIETCACMQQSVYHDGKVQELLITDTKWMVYECCADCHCQKRKEQCPSIVKYRKLKFHLVHFINMGWALRVMEPVERGEPIVIFTGIYETEITEENKDWAFTCADCAEDWIREFCGIDDDEAYMLLTPQHKGNSAGRICHSKASNCEFMKLYRGGVSTFEPECLIYATEHLEAGELLWLDYGDAFWSEGDGAQECLCTQELCHDERMNGWLRTLSKTQLFHVLKSREGRKRRRIQKSIQEANVDEEDEGMN